MTQLNEKPPHSTKTPKTFKLRCTNDFVFKMMFIYDPVKGRRWCKDIAESFRNYVVEKADLVGTEWMTEGIHSKDIRLDVCARLMPNRLFNIEMQCGFNKMEIPNRSAYYACTLVNQPDNKGLPYTQLTPVDQMFLLDYDFPAKADQPNKAIHIYQFAEVTDHDILTNLITILIIEMNKIIQMNHRYEEMDRAEKWVWFIKRYNEELSDPIVARLVENDEIFKEANEVLRRMSSDEAVRDAAFEHNRRLMDMAQLKYEGMEEGLKKGKDEGIQLGLTKGRDEGMQLGLLKGREEGRTEGILKQRLDSAKEILMDQLNDEMILKYTGISAQQLQALKTR